MRGYSTGGLPHAGGAGLPVTGPAPFFRSLLTRPDSSRVAREKRRADDESYPNEVID